MPDPASSTLDICGIDHFVVHRHSIGVIRLLVHRELKNGGDPDALHERGSAAVHPHRRCHVLQARRGVLQDLVRHGADMLIYSPLNSRV